MIRALPFALAAVVAVGLASPEVRAADDDPLTFDGSPLPPFPEKAGMVSPGYAGLGAPRIEGAVTLTPKEFDALTSARTFGERSIIGRDERVRVTNTRAYPARATALITFKLGGASYVCTGWFISADTVATAGHCVHEGGGGKWIDPRTVRVYPGANGLRGSSVIAPYGVCRAKTSYTVEGWAVGGKDDHDYGAFKLNCRTGNRVGWYGFFARSSSLNGLTSIINGYPGDKPRTQWKSTDKIRASHATRLFYKNDTVGGMSGSPVYLNRRNCGGSGVTPCAMAIHAYGVYGSGIYAKANHGTRITQRVFRNLVRWAED